MKILIIALLSSLSLVLNAQEKYSTHEIDSLVQAAFIEDQSLRTRLVDIQWRVKHSRSKIALSTSNLLKYNLLELL